MRYYIVTGESSGDMHAANLVSKLKKLDKSMVVRAWGGKRLISEEVSLARDITKNTVMGFWSVIKNLKTLNSDLNFCKEDILSFKADALILVDYPGFNLKIAEFAKKNGIKVFYYIPPKVWAWNKRRIFKLKKFIDYLLVIFPFEVEFYKQYGIKANYFGNPLLDEAAFFGVDLTLGAVSLTSSVELDSSLTAASNVTFKSAVPSQSLSSSEGSSRISTIFPPIKKPIVPPNTVVKFPTIPSPTFEPR